MKKLLLAVVPLLLAIFTFYMAKPSDIKCREVATERLATINIKASPGDMLIKDWVIIKTMKYVSNGDTFPLGSGFFMQVKVNDRKLENISRHRSKSN